MPYDQLSHQVIGAAIEVHRHLGPGLLESAYEACLALELSNRGVRFEQQRELPVFYKGLKIDCGYRTDLIVENQLIVELKACSAVTPVHRAQLLSYLSLSGLSVGLLLNFHVHMMRDGISRLVDGVDD